MGEKAGVQSPSLPLEHLNCFRFSSYISCCKAISSCGTTGRACKHFLILLMKHCFADCILSIILMKLDLELATSLQLPSLLVRAVVGILKTCAIAENSSTGLLVLQRRKSIAMVDKDKSFPLEILASINLHWRQIEAGISCLARPQSSPISHNPSWNTNTSLWANLVSWKLMIPRTRQKSNDKLRCWTWVYADGFQGAIEHYCNWSCLNLAHNIDSFHFDLLISGDADIMYVDQADFWSRIRLTKCHKLFKIQTLACWKSNFSTTTKSIRPYMRERYRRSISTIVDGCDAIGRAGVLIKHRC